MLGVLAVLLVAATVVVPPLRPPVPGEVVAGFTATDRFGPGHRGLDLAVGPGARVTAPVRGRVTFAGVVAGRRWVTVAPHDRVLVTVGPLASASVTRGDLVAVGSSLGVAAGGHGDGALHLSVRVDGVHVDPAPHLVLEPPRATLLADDPSSGPRPPTLARPGPSDGPRPSAIAWYGPPWLTVR